MATRPSVTMDFHLQRQGLFLALLGLLHVSATQASCSDLRCGCRTRESSLEAICEMSSLQDLWTVLKGFSPNSVTSLRLLCLSKEPGSLPDAIFADQRRLVSLSMVGCRIESLGSGYLVGLHDLETLTLRDLDLPPDRLTDLHLVSSHVKNLRIFEASNCGLERVPSLCGFKHLHEVNISGNQIHTLENAGLSCGDDGESPTTVRSEDAGVTVDTPVHAPSAQSFSPGESPEGPPSTNSEVSSTDGNDAQSQDTTVIPVTASSRDVTWSSDDVISHGALSDANESTVSATTTVPSSTTNDFSRPTRNVDQGVPANSSLSPSDRTHSKPDFLDLDISFNPISVISDWFVSSYTHLRSLRATGTLVTALPDRILSHLPRLEVLDCWGCPLRGVVLSLGVNPEVKVLRLSALNASLPAGVLVHFGKLETLELDGVLLINSTFRELIGHSNMTSLRLRSANLTNLDPAVLATMPELRVVDVVGNAIRSLDGSTYSWNNQLRWLNMSLNELRTLPMHVFDNLTQLETLDLSWNRIKRLYSGTFHSTPSLKEIYLQHNALGYLPRNMFRNLTLVHTLKLMGNQLVALPDFTGLSGLLYMDISDNRIARLWDDSLSGLPSLRGISLRGNRLRRIPLVAFRENPRLYILNLALNQIREIETVQGEGPFTRLTSLLYLRLDHNRLTSIRYYLANLRELERVFIDHNEIVEIRQGDLPASLKSILLSDNHLIKIHTGAFVDLPLLETVDLSANYPWLKSLPEFSIKVHRKAKATLVVASNMFQCDCHLGYLKAFQMAVEAGNVPLPIQMPHFRHLDLSFCATHYDPVQVHRFNVTPFAHFVCPYRISCDLLCRCCHLEEETATTSCPCQMRCPSACSCFRGAFVFGQPYVNDVFCRNQQLTSIPWNVPYIASTLSVTLGNISTLPRNAFVKMKQLKWLVLERNKIRSIQVGAFSGLERLKRLTLANNLLSVLDRHVFSHLEDLEYLSVAGNELIVIHPYAFQSLGNMERLVLRGNLLESLPSATLHSLSNVTMYLSDNPWKCDCDFMQTFVEFVGHNGENIADLDNLTCQEEQTNSTNSSLSTVLVIEYSLATRCGNRSQQVNVTVEQARFLDNEAHLAALVTLLLSLTVIAGLVAVVYWRRREIQAMVFAHFGFRFPFAGDVDDDDPRRVYDAFISYSSHDEHFVVRELMPKLERGNRKYKLCVHFRDFPVGAAIADSIVESIESSKRTVLLLSRDFLSSEWCSFERQTAHHHALKQGEHRLVLVLLEDLREAEVEPELQAMLKGGATRLHIDEPLFWDKLCLALPDVPLDRHQGEQQTEDRELEMEHVHGQTDRLDNAVKADNVV